MLARFMSSIYLIYYIYLLRCCIATSDLQINTFDHLVQKSQLVYSEQKNTSELCFMFREKIMLVF